MLVTLQNSKAHYCVIVSEEIMNKFLADFDLHPLSLGCYPFVVCTFWQTVGHLVYLIVLGLR